MIITEVTEVRNTVIADHHPLTTDEGGTTDPDRDHTHHVSIESENFFNPLQHEFTIRMVHFMLSRIA